MRTALAVALCTLALAAAAAASPGRGLLARPFPDDRRCNNTESGRHLIADSDGYVCPRARLDVASGCCRQGAPTERHACGSCAAGAQCCAAYEHCVSCCLAPGNNATELYKTQWRVGNRPETGHWPTPFDYCAGKCRPTSVVTSHENDYIDAAHFCFSASGRPRTRAPRDLPPLPPDAVVVAADAGASCAAACAAAGGLECGDPAPVADCNALRDHFACEAGCDAADDGAAVPGPAYVEPGADKSARPALCVVPREGGDRPACDAATGAVRRLCVCVPPTSMK